MNIVSLLPSATEIICSLGLRDQLVGVTHECNYPQSVVGLPIVTKTLNPHGISSLEIDQHVRQQLNTQKALYSLRMEVLEELKPDIIVTQALCEVCAVSEDEVLDAVCSLPGSPIVINLEPMCLQDMFDTLLMVGEATNKLEQSRSVVRELEIRVNAVRARTEDITLNEQVTVVFLEWLVPLFNAGHWTPELIEYAGGIDSIGNKHIPSVTTPWRKIQEADPDVIFIACCGFDEKRTAQDMPLLMANDGYHELNCLRNKRIYITNGNAYFSSPGPRLVDSLEILAHSLHPTIHPLPKGLPEALNYHL